MINIYDCKNRLVCKADPDTGYVETKYQKQTMKTTLAEKTSLVIERETVRTEITRINDFEFSVKSNII